MSRLFDDLLVFSFFFIKKLYFILLICENIDMLKYLKILLTMSFALILFVPITANNDFNCFTIIAGKNSTSDNAVFIAHNEDDGGDNIFVYMNNISNDKSKYIRLKNNAIMNTIEKPNNLFEIEVTNSSFGNSYFNEYGVVITSNACTSREDKPQITNGGIGKLLRKIIARRAKTAREGVEIAGKLILKYGYYASGRNYAIADSNEGWFLHIVNGKHWVAKRIPDDQVAVISNYYTIKDIDLNDKKNYMGSPDIIPYAIKRGWFSKDKDVKDFDFAKVYSNQKNLKNMVNILRQWRATNLLSKKKYKLDDRLPFSFIPRKNIKITDLFNVLRDHYEDTDYDLTDDYKKGSPNTTKNRTICTETTQYSFVAVLRNDLIEELNNLVWLALRRPDTNAYSPFYFTSGIIPSGYSNIAEKKPEKAFYTFSKLSDLVDTDYKNRIKKIRKQWRSFEKYAIKQIKKKRKEFTYILKQNKLIAKKIISNFIHNLEYKKWFLATELIKEFSK